MEDKNLLTNVSAASLIATIFGVLAALGSITHGVGEILQGNVAPDGLAICSWTEGPIATNMGCEPGITIVPNLLVTGILTILVALALIIWSTVFLKRKHSGLVMILLCIVMLLVGGGVGPPVMGILAGVAGLGINKPLTWWRRSLSDGLGRFFATLWPWIFAICVINGVFLVIGSTILVYLTGLNNADLFTLSFYLSVILLLISIFTGIAYDLHHDGRGAVA